MIRFGKIITISDKYRFIQKKQKENPPKSFPSVFPTE